MESIGGLGGGKAESMGFLLPPAYPWNQEALPDRRIAPKRRIRSAPETLRDESVPQGETQQRRISAPRFSRSGGSIVQLRDCVRALGIALLFSMAAAAQPALRVKGFQAYLFNSKTGQLSQDMLAKGAPELANVPFGKFAATSVLVVVQVELEPQTPVPEKAQIRLVAVESGSEPFAPKSKDTRDLTILDKTSTLGPLSDKGSGYVGFWLDHTGCHAITLKASVAGVREAAPVTTMLRFTCYE